MEGTSATYSKSLSYSAESVSDKTQYYPEESLSGRTQLKQTVFVYKWNIENFGDFVERQHEIPSPIFSTNSIDGTEWKMVLFVRHKYPKGPYVVVSLVKVSDNINPIGVKYAISLVSLKNTKLFQTGEKIFRRRWDFDECEVTSYSEITQNKLLMDNALVILCEMDILLVETPHSKTKKLFSVSEKCQSVSDRKDYSSQDLSNMNCSFNQSKIINKFSDFCNIFDAESDDFENSPKRQSTLKDEDSINVLLNDFESLYMSKSLSDITLVCAGTLMAAHRAVLSARSDYFKQLFAEKGNSDNVILDVKSSVMEAVLYYIYTSKVRPLTVHFALDLYSASKKLCIRKLQEVLFDFLKSIITVTNVTEMLQMCEDLNLVDLKYACLKFVNSNNSEVVRSEKWNWLIKNNPHIAGEVLLTIASFQKTNIL